MTAISVKEKVLQAVAQLPEGVTFEEAMERVYFLYKVERGLAQLREGKTLSHEEVKTRLDQTRR